MILLLQQNQQERKEHTMENAVIEIIKALAKLNNISEDEVKDSLRNGCKHTEKQIFLLTCAVMAMK